MKGRETRREEGEGGGLYSNLWGERRGGFVQSVLSCWPLCACPCEYMCELNGCVRERERERREQ